MLRAFLFITTVFLLVSTASHCQYFDLDVAERRSNNCGTVLLYTRVDNFMKLRLFDSTHIPITADLTDITLAADSVRIIRQNDSLYTVALMYEVRSCQLDVIRISSGEKIATILKHCEGPPFRFDITTWDKRDAAFPVKAVKNMTRLSMRNRSNCFDFEKIYWLHSYKLTLYRDTAALVSISMHVQDTIPTHFRERLKRLMGPGDFFVAEDIIVKNVSGAGIVILTEPLFYVRE